LGVLGFTVFCRKTVKKNPANPACLGEAISAKTGKSCLKTKYKNRTHSIKESTLKFPLQESRADLTPFLDYI